MDRKWGEITFNILQAIKSGLDTTDEICHVIFGDYKNVTPYRRLMGIKRYRRPRPPTPHELSAEERQRFYSMIWKLQKQGLVEKKPGRWQLTKKGRKWQTIIFGRWKTALPKIKYEKESSSEIKLVIFDIPEKEQRKRVWLRFALSRIGFRRLQKSVWIGKVKIPEVFMNHLRKLDLLSYVEILAITKTGTLRAIE